MSPLPSRQGGRPIPAARNWPPCGSSLTGLPRMLRRRRAGATLAGVCTGLVEYFDSDPALVHVGYLSATVLGGLFPGVILCIVLAVFIPGA